MSKDLRQLAKQAQKRGWDVILTKKNHMKFTRPGHRTLFTSGTPSKPSTVSNFKAELQRAEREAQTNELQYS